MGYDAMANGAPAPAVPRDIAGDGKKKRINRSAKLKQCKLDARREQWLSQVKSNDSKVTSMAASPTSPLLPSPLSQPRVRMSRRNSVTRGGREEDSGIHGSSDSESPTRSRISNGSKYKPRKGTPIKDVGCHIGFSSRIAKSTELEDGESAGAMSREGENRPLDDWESVADALLVDKDSGGRNFAEATVFPVKSDAIPGSRNGSRMRPQPISTSPRAWRPDDVSRPRTLPSLSKQRDFAAEVEQQSGPTHYHHILSSPSSCPICCEDLDVTDSSFIPCSCGFRLCLFCHKRILEEDGRCPGCRNQYSRMVGMATDVGGVPLKLSRSCSLSSRS